MELCERLLQFCVQFLKFFLLLYFGLCSTSLHYLVIWWTLPSQYIDMVEHNIVPAVVVMCSAVIYDTCVDHVGIVEVMMVP